VADKQSEDGQNAPAQGPATPATANHSDPRQEEWGTADAVIRPSDPEAAYLRTISTPASAPDWAESSSAPASSRTRKTKPASEATAPESAQQSATHMDNSTQATTQHDQADKNAVSSSSNEIPQAIPPQTEVKKPRIPDVVVVGPQSILRNPLQSLKGMLFKEQTQSVPISHTQDKIDRILSMMRLLGIAMLKSSHATPDVRDTMLEIARAYNMPPVRVVTLPTLIAIQIEGTDRRAEIGALEGQAFRLDQSAQIDALVDRARRGVIEPDDALAQIERVMNSTSRFNPFVQLVGQILMTLAIGLLINPVWPAIPAYLILGLIVGVLTLIGRRFSTMSIAMPVICAAVVTIVASTFLVDLTHEVPIRLIAPALVPFLPGGTLALAAMELTRDEVISGSSRLIYGLSQLLLLAFGVVIGMAIVPDTTTTNEVVLNSIGPWTPLLGIALLALGYVFARSAPEGSYLWLVVALALTYGAQRLGMLIVPPEFSGFFGALVVVPHARFLSKFRTAPSATVTQLVSFWILVPGSIGFISFTEAATGSTQTITSFVTTGISLFAIALGIIVGSGLLGTRERSGG
jgi:uncharacterized membrane protein YjjP (DUF1212 family)